VDLTTGDGLEGALSGCDVVVDASNNSSRRAAEILVGGSRRLLVIAFTVDAGRITALDVMRNPDKLTTVPDPG
jgi:hypothetical protein